MFHVGQEVVCVDDRCLVYAKRNDWFSFLRSWTALDHNLNRDDVYRVTKVSLLKIVEGQVEVLHVDGARHFQRPEIGFPSFQFRPLIEKKADISVFTALLNTAPSKQPEPV